MVYKRRIILPTQQADCVYRQKEIAGAGKKCNLATYVDEVKRDAEEECDIHQ